MIYTVEQPDIRYDSSNAFDIVGNPDEVTEFTACLAALAVEAVANDVSVSNEDAYRFIGGLVRGQIAQEDRATLYEILADAKVLRNERLRRLTSTAADGQITSSELMKEYTLLRGLDLDQEPYYWLSPDGLDMDIEEDGSLAVGVHELDDTFFDSDGAEVAIAKELDLKDFAWQHELIHDEIGTPMVISGREHVTLGKTNNEGMFVPVVTVLHKLHPAASQDTDN